MILIILIAGTFFVKSANGTTVSGAISSNKEWTQLDSPVVLNGTVIVGTNAILTIDAGVTVNLGFYSLLIYGTLMVMGDSNNAVSFVAQPNNGNYTFVPNISEPIVFASSSSPWNDATNSGSIIQNAVLNNVNLQINSASPKIENCIINSVNSYNTPISINGGSPIISKNTLEYVGQGSGSYFNSINIYGGSPSILNNLFEGNYASSNTNGIVVNSGSPQIANNEFRGNGFLTGVVVSTRNSFTVSGNKFSNCLLGIKVQSGAALTIQGNSFISGTDGLYVASGTSPTITNNLIDSNSRFGIDGGGYIDSNTITNNEIGIHNPPASTIISNNNIVANKVNSITATTASIDASNNWWGTSDAPTINQTIYDSKIDNTLGIVNFVPYLNSSNPQAPSIPSYTPMITPIPTPKMGPTPPPIIPTPVPTPFQFSNSFVYQVGAFFNLGLIVTATFVSLIVVWLIVLLGYVVKRGINRYKNKK